jgi:hypothetical protein
MTVDGPWFDAGTKCSSDRDHVIHELEERNRLNVREKDWSGREDLNLRPPGPEPDYAESPKVDKITVLRRVLLVTECVIPDSLRRSF